MSHENPASIVAGSIHLSREGKKVFIQAVQLKAPWKSEILQPVQGTAEGTTNCHYYNLNGQFYNSTESGHDLVREYKEPVAYEAYVIVWSNGTRDTRCTLRLAEDAAKAYNDERRTTTWKIFKLTGSEEIIDNEPSK